MRLAALTPRERDILDAIAAGLGNKAIARQLALSPRTVEVHRANIMRRAGAGNVAELLRLQFTAEYERDASVGRVRFGAWSRGNQIGRGACRERECLSGESWGVAVA